MKIKNGEFEWVDGNQDIAKFVPKGSDGFTLYEKVDGSDYITIVNELNDELYERCGYVESSFSYHTNGYVEIILYGSTVLWSSEMEEREWIEEDEDYEPLKPFIKRIFNEEVGKLEMLKF